MSNHGKARKLYLHIGTEKTGSTTLQHFAHVNRKLLLKRGILYPRNQIHSSLSGYASAVTMAPVASKFFDIDGPESLVRFRASLLETLHEQIVTSQCHTIWLTSERLSAYIRRQREIEKLAELTRSLADEVKIILYLREQADLFLSSYSSGIKSGRDADMNPPVTPGLYYYDYEKMISHWSGVFGDAAMIVRIFDRRSLTGGDIVKDFLGVIGIDDDAGFERKPDLNPRLDVRTLQFLRLFNRFVGQLDPGRTSPLRGPISTVLANMSDGPAFTVPADVVTAIRAAYSSSNAAVARKWFGQDDGVLFTPTPLKDLPFTTLTVEEAVEIAAKLWIWQQQNKSGRPSPGREPDIDDRTDVEEDLIA
jgi:hypothetical protein